MLILLGRLFFIISIFFFLGDCTAFHRNQSPRINPDPIEQKESPTPREEFPEGFEKMKESEKPKIIQMMRKDFQEAKEYIEDILKKRKEKRDQFERLESIQEEPNPIQENQ